MKLSRLMNYPIQIALNEDVSKLSILDKLIMVTYDYNVFPLLKSNDRILERRYIKICLLNDIRPVFEYIKHPNSKKQLIDSIHGHFYMDKLEDDDRDIIMWSLHKYQYTKEKLICLYDRTNDKDIIERCILMDPTLLLHNKKIKLSFTLEKHIYEFNPRLLKHLYNISNELLYHIASDDFNNLIYIKPFIEKNDRITILKNYAIDYLDKNRCDTLSIKFILDLNRKYGLEMICGVIDRSELSHVSKIAKIANITRNNYINEKELTMNTYRMINKYSI